jgi:hypothetical protein
MPIASPETPLHPLGFVRRAEKKPDDAETDGI